MEHSLFYKTFKQEFTKKYRSTVPHPLPPISPFIIPIDKHTQRKIKNIIKILYKMAHSENYPQLIQTKKTVYLRDGLPDTALLMAYDFHIDKEGQPKLIEVNTQASGYLVSDLVDQVHCWLSHTPESQKNSSLKQTNFNPAHSHQKSQMAHPCSPALLALKKSFEEEWQSFSLSKKHHSHATLQKKSLSLPPENTLIVDHQIPKQKMYVEFLMFKELLDHQWHWPCQLMEIGEVHGNPEGFLVDKYNKKVDMIYNRSTDFYLEKYPILKKAFLNQTACISPHSREYLLLADKARLVEWSNPHFLNQTNLSKEEKHQVQQALPRTGYVHSVPAEELWKKRKSLFFKPLQGYGGKAVYRGKSLSRKMFEWILSSKGTIPKPTSSYSQEAFSQADSQIKIKTPMLFQDFVPPPIFKDPSGVEWKYDIRAYVYRDRVLKFCARVYQGQVTGFQKPLSGFATLCQV